MFLKLFFDIERILMVQADVRIEDELLIHGGL